jgi:hypothetical protein
LKGIAVLDLIRVRRGRIEKLSDSEALTAARTCRPPTLFDQKHRSRFGMTLNTHPLIVESDRDHLGEGLDELLWQPSSEETPAARFGPLRVLLDSLPLDTTEFGLAVDRLANAQHYLESGDHGASFELRLLRRSLKQ